MAQNQADFIQNCHIFLNNDCQMWRKMESEFWFSVCSFVRSFNIPSSNVPIKFPVRNVGKKCKKTSYSPKWDTVTSSLPIHVITLHCCACNKCLECNFMCHWFRNVCINIFPLIFMCDRKCKARFRMAWIDFEHDAIEYTDDGNLRKKKSDRSHRIDLSRPFRVVSTRIRIRIRIGVEYANVYRLQNIF